MLNKFWVISPSGGFRESLFADERLWCVLVLGFMRSSSLIAVAVSGGSSRMSDKAVRCCVKCDQNNGIFHLF